MTYYNITYKRNDVYQSNIAYAETIEDVRAHYESSEHGPTEIIAIEPAHDWDVRNARERGKPIVKCEHIEQPEPEQQAETESAPSAPAVIVPQGYTAAEAVVAITAGPALLHRVAVTVPSTCGPDTPADAETVARWIAYTMRELSAACGGCTAVNGSGAWIDGSGRLICEAVTVCTSYTDAITAETVRAVREIAEAVRAGMDQDAVTVEIDGAAGFVERPAAQAEPRTVAEALAAGWTLADRAYQRGYCSRRAYNLDAQPLHKAGGRRRGQLYAIAPCYRSSQYCIRQYLDAPQT